MSTSFVTLGEILLRLTPPGHERLSCADEFQAFFGGSEANVALSLAQFGMTTDVVTRLPDNDLGHAALSMLRSYKVGTRYLKMEGERLGIYFLETGAAQRGSRVLYDRRHSAFSGIGATTFDWNSILQTAHWFHWSGITPALSMGAAAACRNAIQTARRLGLRLSCDLNYRSKLWDWGLTPAEVMPNLVSQCDLLIGDPHTFASMFALPFEAGPDIAEAPSDDVCDVLCRQLRERFPQARHIAFSLRGSHSASHNSWSGILWHSGRLFRSRRYAISPIVDRIGSGDAFSAGLIYGLNRWPDDNQRVLDFAVAASCLKHSIPGDFNRVSVAEVEKLMSGDADGRIER